jgi:branched-chain amino acid aminotransferase
MWSTTWTFFDGAWHEGNPPILGPRSHAFWLGSSVFDGARYYDGVAPDLDLHFARVNRSAVAMHLKALVSVEEWTRLAWQQRRRRARWRLDPLVALDLRGPDAGRNRLRHHAVTLPPPDARNHAARC